MKKLKLTILTPERVIIEDKEVDSVIIPAYEGEMGVLPGHIPYIAQLKEGILRYRDGEKEEVLSIFWGYFEVRDNKVIILAEDAKLAKEIDEEKERQEYQRLKEAFISKDKAYNFEDLEIQLKKSIVNLKLSELRRKTKK